MEGGMKSRRKINQDRGQKKEMTPLKLYRFQEQKDLKAAFIAENVRLLQGLAKRVSVLRATEGKCGNETQGTR